MNANPKELVRGVVHSVLRPAEARLVARHPVTKYPPCFIVGAPRSGTSLFYELFVTRFHLAYFSNLAHRFWQTPAAATRFGMPVISARQPQFTSEYGHIKGWSAPNEGGLIWRRWLVDGDWSNEEAARNLPVEEIRATLGAIEAVMGALFVNKNVMHSNRMRLLDAIFPGCTFIEVKRDPVATVRSIVRAERGSKGPIRHSDDWWSVRPSNAAPGEVVERAVRQVVGVAADIERDGAFLGGHRLLSIDYAHLCKDPESSLGEAAAFLEAHGVEVPARSPVPKSFNLPPPRPLDRSDEEQMHVLLSKMT